MIYNPLKRLHLRREGLLSELRKPIWFAPVLGRKLLNPSLLLEASYCAVKRPRAQPSAAHFLYFIQHRMPMLGAACQARKDEELRIGEMTLRRF